MILADKLFKRSVTGENAGIQEYADIRENTEIQVRLVPVGTGPVKNRRKPLRVYAL